MSTQLMKKISGSLIDQQGAVLSRLPLGVSIAFTTLLDSTAPGGWIGSATVKTTGSFELLTTYELGVVERLKYQMMKEGQLIAEGETLLDHFNTQIPVTDNQYMELMQQYSDECIVIKGKVTMGEHKVAAVPVNDSSVFVSVNKVGFRDEQQIAKGNIDEYGHYCIRIPVNKLRTGNPSAESTACCHAGLSPVFIALNVENIIIERSEILELGNACTEANIHTEKQEKFSSFLTEFEYVCHVITSVTGLTQNEFYSITTEGATPEISAVIAASKLEAGMVSNMISAAGVNKEKGIVLSHSYALSLSGGIDPGLWLSLDLGTITGMIHEAESGHIIPQGGDINDTYNRLQEMKKDALFSEQTENGDLTGTVIGSILDNTEDVRTFLKLSSEYAALPPHDFWNAVNEALPGKTDILKRGLQSLALTGMQPEITKQILNMLSAGPDGTTLVIPAPLSDLANYDRNAWLDLVNQVCVAHDKLCVPAAVLAASAETGTDPKVDYANRLFDITTDWFASVVIKQKLRDDGDFAALFNGHATAISNFIESTAGFDFRVDNVWDIDDEKIASAKEVREVLMPVQNIMRLTAGKPEAVVALLKSNIKSSADIASMTQENFTAAYSSVLGSPVVAGQVYAQAQQTALVTTQAYTQLNANALNTPVAAVQQNNPSYVLQWFANPPANSQSPDLRTLFGNMDSCNCAECTSMYSPAAYFTDILNFIQNKLPIPNNNNLPFKELIRRRPDLQNIDLTCKNSNTAIPYVDLVNEILELEILRYKGVSIPFESYQTSGKSAALRAYPEHTYKDDATGVYETSEAYKQVYDSILNNSVYPNSTALHLALEESRTYFSHLGYSRYALMQQFKPEGYETTAALTLISSYNAAAERLGLSKREADIITKIIPGSPGIALWEYYGFGNETNPNPELNNAPILWYNLLCNNITPLPTVSVSGLRTLLERANISYTELLQCLDTECLNPKLNNTQRTLAISAVTAAGQESCDLGKLKIVYGDDTVTNTAVIDAAKKIFFDKLHRFIRLQRATGWSIYQLDMVLQSLGVNDMAIVNIISSYDYIFTQIARIHLLSEQLQVAPEKLCAFWSGLNTLHYINYNNDNQEAAPSVYDSLFRNKAVLNQLDPDFDDPAALPLTYTGHTGTIMAATNVREEELARLFMEVNPSATPTALNLPVLSRVYALSLLAGGLQVSVVDLLRSCKLMDTAVTISDTAAEQLKRLETIVANQQALAKTALSLDEMEYLFMHKDTQEAFVPAAETIKIFYENLRTGLQKQIGQAGEQEINTVLLGNIVIRQFSTTFNMDASLVQYLLQKASDDGSGILQVTHNGLGTVECLYDMLTDAGFVNSSDAIVSTGSIPQLLNFSDLYREYIRMHKIAFIVNRLKISTDEFKTIQLPQGGPLSPNGITNLGLMQFYDIPTGFNPAPDTILKPFMKLSEWIRLRDRLNLRKDEFTDLLGAVLQINGYTSPFIQKLAGLTGWSSELLNFLIGDILPTVTNNVLGTSSIAIGSFKNASLLHQLADIVYTCQQLGLTPNLIFNALQSNLVMADSQAIRQAAKAKHTDEEWLKIAKPLQDVLREKQRKALVAYAVAHPDMGDADTNSQLRWKDADGLFAYYLIDVDMKPCMQTSRIKQAISAVQLFMDRIILNLENKEGILTTHIIITPDKVDQWEEWRKWYRIWEANRKIFLYPENWMEPELRDDKTPFFKTLETQLLQDAVTDRTAEEAFRAYLEDLDEVARLEPVSAWHQEEKNSMGKVVLDIKHVFARTASEPHRHYYRRLQDDMWSPWEKVNVDIKSDHVVPVMWHRRLYLCWLTFIPKKSKTWYDKTDPFIWANKVKIMNNGRAMTIVDDENEDDRQSTWDIKLNWSQYKDGKWLATEMCSDVMNINPSMVRLTQLELDAYNATTPDNMQYPFFSALSNNGDLKLAELFKNRLYLAPYFVDNNEDKPLVLSLNFYSRPDDVGASTLCSFIFPDPVSKPYVDRAWEKEYTMLSPIGTHANKMKFEKISEGSQSAQNQLRIESVGNYQDWQYSYHYRWYKANTNGNLNYQRRRYNGTNGTLLLNNTPENNYGKFRLTKFANAADGNFSVLRDYFFFEDNVNTYYVQKVPAVLATAISSALSNTATGITLTSTNQIASGNYPLTSSNTAVLTGAGMASSGNIMLSGGLSPAVAVAQSQLYSYRFQTFYHAQIHRFMNILNKDGVPGLLQINNQKQTDNMLFGPLNSGTYKPTVSVDSNYPKSNVQFGPSDPYSIYNWEIFFHAPMIAAQRLSENQQFEDAQKWYHYIFNPTSSTNIDGNAISSKQRFWKFYPFYNIAASEPQTLLELLQEINTGLVQNSVNQVTQWEKNPFNPFVVARMRNLAFMKNVVMKYLDNLIAWGDQLFSRDTIESINEASQLYILAANILGKRPESIPQRVKPSDPYTYEELTETQNGLDTFSNALVNIESFFAPNTGTPTGTGSNGAPIYGSMFYFCLPQNDKLMGYWDTVGDRLFKIRNCMNIAGAVRQLPLYEPPVDPALLVRARAMGIDIGSIVDATTGSAALTSPYRFSYMLQKANEFCNDVKSLGNALLSALEKKDAEALALLRSGQEMQLLDKITFVKEQQVQEAQAVLDAMHLTKENTQLRYEYYSGRSFMNSGEQQQLQSIQKGLALQLSQAKMQEVASALSLIPQFSLLSPFAIGPTFGGQQLSASMNAISAHMGISIAINNARGSMAGTLGSYNRRNDDWTFQAGSASKELEQVEQQILGAQIRLDIAGRELDNHLKQIENTRAVDDYMRNKFSNADLYSWMSNQVASTYFQSYQLAYDLAKKADRGYRYELPLAQYPTGGFITFGYWDSLKKGLLSGEKLQFDLRKMEATYMDENVRELELTKNISLVMNDPKTILDLRSKGYCSIDLPEELFDLDYPGHYNRRIKSVSISIPCITGPYTTIPAMLTLSQSAVRKVETESPVINNATQQIAASSAQNDSGVFELNFRDERYLPFEGRGVISKWNLSLVATVTDPAVVLPEQVRNFDFDTITDVILHIRYTAKEGTDTFKKNRISNINNLLASPTAASGLPMPRYFSLKHDFSNEWYKGFSQTVPVSGVLAAGSQMDLQLLRSQLPEYVAGKPVTVTGIDFILKPADPSVHYKLAYGAQAIDLNSQNGYQNSLTGLGTSLNLGAAEDVRNFSFVLYQWNGTAPQTPAIAEKDLDDVFFVLYYKLS